MRIAVAVLVKLISVTGLRRRPPSREVADRAFESAVARFYGY